jgi:hypothetical protein
MVRFCVCSPSDHCGMAFPAQTAGYQRRLDKAVWRRVIIFIALARIGEARIEWVAKALCLARDPDDLFVRGRSGKRLVFAGTVPSGPSASPTR